ncbi:GNAT family N-acetyltransferase [Bradyrhizobium sp. AUGA SZCCT0177]|uniref:GNAT family N-acetyltransferase n=1 Tax=Bradyrhizobium sp. AUGA SZCCT0177 TaxID=2807665 RepID=UPI0024BFD08A|nr:GNAT family N-acetyltransferase [Bradyrhizobium sp. AUGA SZCCT0177]
MPLEFGGSTVALRKSNSLGKGKSLNSDGNVPISRSLGTERLYLRGAVADDAPAMNAAIIVSWTELSRWMDWAQGTQPTIQETMERIDKREAGFEDRSELNFSIFEKRAGTFIGNCSLFRFDWAVPRSEIGYWCATNKVGHGYITEAVLALTEFAWSLGLVRVDIRCDAMNLRSRAVAARAGFALEGILKNDCRTPQGALRDSCVFAQVPRNIEMSS